MSVSVLLDDQPVDVGRIFCIGRNYAAHAAELGSELGEEPVLFMKPPSAIVAPDRSVRLPRGRGVVHHEAELVLLIGRDDATDARDVAGIALGLDLTLRDVQNGLKARGLPWELAKAFDDSAPLGNFTAPPEDLAAITFECRVNGELRQRADTRRMLFPVPRLIAFLASRFALRRGDLVFTGTPEGVGPLRAGDVVELSSAPTGLQRWRCT